MDSEGVRRLRFDEWPEAPVVVRDDLRVQATGRLVTERVKLIFVLSGRTRFEHAGARSSIELSSGSVVTVPDECWCASEPIGHARTVTLYMHRGFLAANAPWVPAAHPLAHQLGTALGNSSTLGLIDIGERGMRSIAPKLRALAATAQYPEDGIAVLAEMASVFDDVGRMSGAASRPRPDAASFRTPVVCRDEVAYAIRLLHEQLDRRWSIRELAAAVSLSESQLSRVFRQATAMSPAAFLWGLRTDRLAELLTTTSLSVEAAAAATGWRNPSSASRAFRRRFGVSPSEFALRARGGLLLDDLSSTRGLDHRRSPTGM